MIKKLQNPKFRQAFVASNVRRGIAYQLRAMRGKRSQAEIGKLIDKPQNVVSRLENPRYGKVSVQTLLEVAAAFDVALIVKFCSFGQLLRETENLSQEALAPLSFEQEMKASQAATQFQMPSGEVMIGVASKAYYANLTMTPGHQHFDQTIVAPFRIGAGENVFTEVENLRHLPQTQITDKSLLRVVN